MSSAEYQACLALSIITLGRFRRQKIIIVSFPPPPQKIGFGISCKLPFVKCQSLFSGEKKKDKYFKMSSAEIFMQPVKC